MEAGVSRRVICGDGDLEAICPEGEGGPEGEPEGRPAPVTPRRHNDPVPEGNPGPETTTHQRYPSGRGGGGRGGYDPILQQY